MNKRYARGLSPGLQQPRPPFSNWSPSNPIKFTNFKQAYCLVRRVMSETNASEEVTETQGEY